MSDTVRLVFTGDINKKSGRTVIQKKYKGDGVSCDTDQPKSCFIAVTPEKEEQLNNDYPGMFKKDNRSAKEIQAGKYSNKMIAGSPESRGTAYPSKKKVEKKSTEKPERPLGVHMPLYQNTTVTVVILS